MRNSSGETLDNRATSRMDQINGTIIGAAKSVFNSRDRKYFTLEQKTKTENYDIGFSDRYILDLVTLGRDKSNSIPYGDDCKTVSRKHAAIKREGDGWIIVHLGKNPTIVNDEPVQGKRKLENGDQIQLSWEGPKMVFLTPYNNTVKSLGFTARINAASRQIAKPYKTAIAILSLFIILFSISGIIFIVKQGEKSKEQEAQIEQLKKLASYSKDEIDSLNATIIKQLETVQKDQKSNSQSDSQISESQLGAKDYSDSKPVIGNELTPILNKINPSVYYIRTDKIEYIYGEEKIVYKNEEGKNFKIEGTGFLLDDGTFITARHVAFPWTYIVDKVLNKDLVILNLIAENGGKVIHYFTASSSSGSTISFKSTNFTFNDDDDEIKAFESDGKSYNIRIASDLNDWSRISTDLKGTIKSGKSECRILTQATLLHVLGYPLGIGGGEHPTIPTYSTCTVGRNGCESDELIRTTDSNIDPGNSGGPALLYRDKSLFVIGIVSSISGRSQGNLVPIDLINK